MSDATAALLYLHAITGLHVGSGTALGVVDLPIQRERHTQWPVVPGSSLKGVLKDTLRTTLNDSGLLAAIFGPETDQASDHAGALTVTDARILAFPVRSLKGVFAWITCKGVLDRYARDLGLAKIKAGFAIETEPEAGKMLVAKDSPLLIDGKDALLEEFDFSRSGDSDRVAGWLADHAGIDKAAKARLKSHLVVLNDSDFTHFVVHATEVTARIGLDHQTRTVKDGALFYEEFLPPESLLYAVVLAGKSRKKEIAEDGAALLKRVRTSLPRTLQIGAGGTIGKGLTMIHLSNGENA